ncbi:hypothetical protein QTL95_18320 [Rhizobium sp. S152]|uniref:hypothetical protein n=1 Tax=Rhizobium sp. S152 TaxID=3055038 RepID=UPI0025A97D93|nr:hypothetical protein [Rhizobium sp. S152]MDM9627850.1 hypothetical protein [Rhizobium sp. S152]
MSNDQTFSPLLIGGIPAAELRRKLYGHRGRLRNNRGILEQVQYDRAGVAPINQTPESTVYLTPDREHVGATTSDEFGDVWIEPTPSSGLRSVDFKSTSSFRGHVPYRDQNTRLAAESMIEARLAKILQVNRRIVDIRDQYPLCHYLDDGEQRETIFDYWVQLDNQMRVAIAVKPANRVRKSGILRTLKLCAEQGIGSYADRVALFTDIPASLDNEYNAAWILRSRRAFNQAEFDQALARIQTVYGSTRFHDLLLGAPSQAGRRTAIWNLIDEGYLVAEEPGRIKDLSWLRHNLTN